jgi:ribonuclease R
MLHVPIMIGDATAKSAKAGDQVVVEIVRYPSEGRPAKGVIVQRLGQAGETGVDVLSIIHQFRLPHEFPEEVLQEVRAAAKAFDPDGELTQREDLTKSLTITIDPDDAKDYDDAISLERLSGAKSEHRAHGRASASHAMWELGVHIADVSAFVPEEGPTDAEAVLRGTSVYLPRYVIPMLPESLSNGLCSLQEGEPRLCKSAFIRYDAGGNVVGARFANTVIKSTKRLTYRQATAVLDGKDDSQPAEVTALIKRMDTLARTLQKRRYVDGMISLELPEVELILDDEGRVVDARPEDTSFSHTIIEMFMVEANEAVARLLQSLDVPFIRRIHPDPEDESLEATALTMKAAGINVPKKLTAHDLQTILKSLSGRPGAYAINLAILKTMEMAEYSPRNVGHFALASKCYAHFTSPIRRYADLTIHRLLGRYLAGKLGPRGRGLDEAPSHEELVDLSRKLSYLSRRAESAETELKTLKVLELLTKHVGDEFEGVVTGVTNFGLFVQHPKYLIDGLLRIEDLGDDWWEVDLKVGRVVGERTRQTFAMGAVLTVRIVEIDLAARQMKLGLLGIKTRSQSSRSQPAAIHERTRRGQKPGGRRGKPEARRGKGFRKRGSRRRR